MQKLLPKYVMWFLRLCGQSYSVVSGMRSLTRVRDQWYVVCSSHYHTVQGLVCRQRVRYAENIPSVGCGMHIYYLSAG